MKTIVARNLLLRETYCEGLKPTVTENYCDETYCARLTYCYSRFKNCCCAKPAVAKSTVTKPAVTGVFKPTVTRQTYCNASNLL